MTTKYIPQRTPVILMYHKVGFLISQDCWDGNIHLHKDQNPSSYVFDLGEMSVAGKLIDKDKISTLSLEERNNVINRGWLYKYTPRPITYWPKDQAKKMLEELQEKNIKEIILMARQLPPQIVKDFMQERKIENFTRDDYIRMLLVRPNNYVFYPLCNENKNSAINFKEWVYYLDYACWIDKMADRCACMECYPLRTVNPNNDAGGSDDYSLNQLFNKHCYLCSCEKCNCFCNSKFGKFQSSPLIASKESPCLGTCYICRNT